MDLELKEKVFLVSAASKGLGFGIAQALSHEGAVVHIGSRNAEELTNASKRLLLPQFTKVTASILDVQNYESIKTWISEASRIHGRIDGLVVNAGGPQAGTFESLNDESWSDAYTLTLMSAVRLIREVLPILKRQGGGSILLISSSSVKEPIDGLILSNVFRAGLQSLVKTLSKEFASYGIRVNSIVPGRIETDRVVSLDTDKALKLGISIEEVEQAEKRKIPLKRYGTIEEFGASAAFLLSGKASYITGTMLVVDGGKINTL